MDNSVYKDTVIIANGEAVSSAIALGGISKKDIRLFSIIYPAAWTAASLTFQSSYDGGATWNDVYKDGSEYTKTVTAGKDDDVDLHRFSSIPMLRLRSGTSASPVAQSAARTITLVLRSV